MKKHSTKTGKETNTVSEPAAVYANKKITFFKSIEEENEHTWRQYAALSPEERLAAVTKIRLAAYPRLNTILNPWGNTLYFDK